jgi:hypothetical protein
MGTFVALLMKTKSNIPKSKNTMILIMGILAAMTILSGQVYQTKFTAPVEISEDGTSDETDDQPQISIKSVDAVATAASVSLVHQFYFITEILHTEEKHEASTFLELPRLSTFFATLFRQIISPNAP